MATKKRGVAKKKPATPRRIRCSTYGGKKLYKVLERVGYDEVSPGVGGAKQIDWSLPRGKRPGAWQTVEGPIKICDNGLHVTTKPKEFINYWLFDWNSRVYEVQVKGDHHVAACDSEGKVAYRSVRLLRRVPLDELPG